MSKANGRAAVPEGKALFFRRTEVSEKSDTAPTVPRTTELVKTTFYIRPDQLERLEDLRYERRKRGHRVDKSQLVREALDRFAEAGG